MKIIFPILLLISFFNFVYGNKANLGLIYPKSVSCPDVFLGEDAKTMIILKNTSAKDINIKRIKTSCGCTTIKIKNHQLKAKSEMVLPVTMTTTQKTGRLSKRVRIYLKEQTHPLNILIHVNVLAQPKVQHHQAMKSKSIFSAKCAACHVNPGHKKMGRALYLADCAMCHGIFKQGHSAPSLKALSKALSPEQLMQKISIGKEPLMPGFAKEHGGPLSPYQIKTLVSYLKNESFIKHNSKSGRFIYHAWCSHCHGTKRHGPIGPALTKESLSHYTAKELKDIIANGIPESVMSPFSKKKGGPLSENDIDLLVNDLLGKK